MADLYKKGFTQNRELSWLRFNDRVLAEATDQTVPLLERLRFISIFTSNLDEFFMIRVGSLTDMADIEEKTGEKVIDNKSGMTPDEQLEKIFEAIRPLCGKRERIFFEVERQLRAHGIYQLGYDELEQSERKNVRKYFEASVRPILSPQIVDAHHPFPHLANNVIHIGVMLRHKNKEIFGVIPVPASLPPLFYLPGTETRCIRTENIIFEYAESIFDPYTVKEKDEKSPKTQKTARSREAGTVRKDKRGIFRLFQRKTRPQIQADIYNKSADENGLCVRHDCKAPQTKAKRPDLS